MCTTLSALKSALFSLFECWKTHSQTHFEGGKLPAEREHTSRIMKQQRMAENTKADSELQDLRLDLKSPEFLWQR